GDQRPAPSQGRAPTDPGAAPDRSGHRLAAADGALVWREHRRRGGGHRDRGLVSRWAPDGRAALGAAAGARRALRAPSAAVDRPGRGPSPDHRLVRAPLAARGDLPRSPRPPRRRDPAPMVGPGYPARHPGPARAVLAGDAVRRRAAAWSAAAGPSGRLVPQSRPDLRRHPGLGPPAALARHAFLHVACRTRPRRNPAGPLGAPHHHARLRRIIWTKPNQGYGRKTPTVARKVRICSRNPGTTCPEPPGKGHFVP